MLKLFKVQANPNLAPVYFDSKRAAKHMRDDLNNDAHYSGVVVMRGPDHWKGESFNTSKGN